MGGEIHMASKYLISICITSYKRLKELDRCLNSIDSHYVDDVEIVVSEDHSPEKENIEKLVKAFSETSPYHVVFNSNEQNLGYDRNLKKLMTLANTYNSIDSAWNTRWFACKN